MGEHRSPRVDAAVGQPNPERPLQAGGARTGTVFGAWTAIRLPDRGGEALTEIGSDGDLINQVLEITAEDDDTIHLRSHFLPADI